MHSTPESPNVKHCEWCGEELPPKRRRFCNKKCNSAWRSANYRIEKTYICKGCGIEFNPKARNRTDFHSRECAFAYRNRLKAERSERLESEVAADLRPCEICGEPCSRKGAHICSDDACKKERERRRSREYGVASKTASPRKCKECGTIFTPEYGDKRKDYCSHKCGRKAGKRKGKKHTGTLNNVTRKRLRTMYGDSWRSMYEPINKRRVFERDRWRCQLCGCKVKRTTEWDPRQATIDHIIPLSLGGEHKYTNVQTACMECNSKKGATIQGQQRLFG